MLLDLSKRLRRVFWERVRGLFDIFHLLPPIAAILIFRLLTDVPQTREIYLSYIEDQDPWHIGWAILGFSLISAALYGSHYWLSRIRINIIYATFLHPNTGLNFRRIRRFFGAVWSLTPWAGLIFGLLSLRESLYTNQGLLRHIQSSDPQLSAEVDNLLQLTVFGWVVALLIVIVVGIAVTVLLHVTRRSRLLPFVLVATVALLMVAAALIPLLGAGAPATARPWDAIQVYRWVGPLGTMALAILFVLSLFIALALLSQRSGFPALTMVLVTTGAAALVKVPLGFVSEVLFWVCLILVVAALVSGLRWVAAVTAVLAAMALCTYLREDKQDERITATASFPATFDVQQRFAEWLQHRPDRRANSAADGAKYPVFIIAVEGGGIYAAAAASLFLARLEDRCRGFAHHVFAISGVSGGSIGATMFEAIARDQENSAPKSASPLCAPTTDERLTKRVSQVMLEDHFSPLVGSIIPDFLGETAGRAQQLENSFLESAGPPDGLIVKALKQSYADYAREWPTGESGPALVLNTTWVDTGYRVAFAPFTLKKNGGGTLYSFADSGMPGENVSVMHAAIASARFPGILPPYSVLMPDQRRWSFVDGGYADSSGAATALDLYRAIGTAEDFKRQNLDVKIILLTSADPQPNFADIDSTAFRDTLAPLDAIMNVRLGLGNQAVARVCDSLQMQVATCKNKETSDPKSSLLVVQLPEQAYSLPLGWKLSRATFDLVSLLIGRPEQCVPEAPRPNDSSAGTTQDPNPQIIRSNGCVLRSIEETLTAK
jgi:hypothetical protein